MGGRRFLARALEIRPQRVALGGHGRELSADGRALRLKLGDASVAQTDHEFEHRQLLALAFEQLLEFTQIGGQIA